MNIPEYENYHEEKVNRESLFPYTTYICSIPLDFHEVPNHWHEDMEIIYIKKGSGIVSLDLEEFPVHAGDLVIVLPGQLHGIRESLPDKMEYENIIFSTTMFIPKISDSVDTEFFMPLLSGRLTFLHHVTPDLGYYGELAHCLDEADRICTTFPKGYKLALKGCLYQFFYVLYSNADEGPKSGKNTSLARIKDILKYVETHYQQEITIDEIAEVAGFSSSHFMKFFKKEMGTSFIDYLNQYRLSMATRLLLSSDSNILEIAEECGYDNLSYFTRLFKKRYGITPGDYRKKEVKS